KLRIGGAQLDATRYTFATGDRRLQGTVWLDGANRLLQIEFPNPKPDMALRVVLAEPPVEGTPGPGGAKKAQ
ncbi:MAG: hypothetical protein HY721_17555, partial [Planctomycetes bacterium]|nr:hypothetical protein [Planctomycetota bacterium]